MTQSTATATFRARTGKYELTAGFPVVSVRNLATGLLEAYSSAKADYEQSLEEFTEDYLRDEGRG